MPETNELYIGLMSGTSVDGIDAALVSISSASKVRVIETQFTAFNNELRKQINTVALSQHKLSCCSDSILDQELAKHYATASLSLIDKAGIQAKDVSAIANHGQTVRHEPDASPPITLQLGDPQRIANQTNIRTIGQFRLADIATGGQGAPLMPAFHQAVFNKSAIDTQETTHCRFVLNIGGIANITRLNETVIGFDTGPGNTLLDQWVSHHKNLSYDDNGNWARSGQCIPELLETLLNDPYFKQPFPKSTGTDYFNLCWLESKNQKLKLYAPNDVQATLLTLTAKTIAQSIRQTTPHQNKNAEPIDIFICGGGAHNSTLLLELSNELPQANIQLSDELGVPADWVEAAGFAWLGYCTMHNIPSNLPSVTGANKRVVQGQIYEPITGQKKER